MIYPANLPPGVKPIVLLVHDESTFNANNDRSRIWIKDDHIPWKNKTHGKGIMVSDFLTPGGRLQVSGGVDPLPTIEYENSDKGPKRLDSHLAACSIEYDSVTRWNGDQLVDQVLRLTIPIFECAYPGCEALFLFDNATSHSAYTADALRASLMNLCPSGAQQPLRSGINSLKDEIQAMV